MLKRKGSVQENTIFFQNVYNICFNYEKNPEDHTLENIILLFL